MEKIILIHEDFELRYKLKMSPVSRYYITKIIFLLYNLLSYELTFFIDEEKRRFYESGCHKPTMNMFLIK